MQRYVIFDFSKGLSEEPTVIVVTEDELWTHLNKNHDDKNYLISVYKLGKCVLDFS